MQNAREFKSFLKTVGGNEGSKCRYPTRLDTYGCGCLHDCHYCYAKSLLEFRKLWNPRDPSVADPAKVERAVARIAKSGEARVLRLGGMTDCFQACEATYRATYHAIDSLNRHGLGYLIVTKSDMVARDEYVSLMDRGLAHVQVTVTSTDDARAATYESAPPPSRRIAAIEKLQSLGFDVSLRLSPYIEGFVDFNVLNAVKCDKILVEFLRVNSWIKKWFAIDYTPYTVKHGGYMHAPLEWKKAVLKRITGFKEVSVCEDEDEAYAYWRDHVNPNPDDCCNLRRSPTYYTPPNIAANLTREQRAYARDLAIERKAL